MCLECDDDLPSRRSFMADSAAALAGLALVAGVEGDGGRRALEDPRVIHHAVNFKSGADTINGYLARPNASGRFPAVVVLHGNAGMPEDVRNAAAQAARAGFVGLVVESTSREHDASRMTREFVSSNRYLKRYVGDAQAGIDYLKERPFVRAGGAGVIGFCGGGITGLVLSTSSADVRAVVALYAAPFFTPGRNSPEDPRPDLITFVGKFRSPVQCHFGTEDEIIPAGDVEKFRSELARHKVYSEVYVYEGAGHAFYDYTRGAYRPAAARLAEKRMLSFLKRHLR